MTKRLIIILAAVIVFCACVPVAQAGFGIHKSFEKNADTCTGCHRQHVPIQQQLGVETAPSVYSMQTNAIAEYETCLVTCHGVSVEGADCDVESGVYRGTLNGISGGSLNGGGFIQVGGKAVTSTHLIDGATSTVPFGGSTTMVINCSTCHNPDGSSNYRLLRDSVNGVNVAGFVSSNEAGFSSESITMPREGKPPFITYQPNYTAYAAGNTGVQPYKTPTTAGQGMSGWCASCHTTYNEPTQGENFHHGVGVDMTDETGKLQNPLNNDTVLPLDKATGTTPNSDPDNQIQCLTCHYAHGTSVDMTVMAQVEPTKSSPSSGPGFSALLRLDNRGVCQNCHGK
ncbi:MAG: hypothetical protein C4562_03595 [Actinobacteria bacterium]|nr:MAG: hypothetical protein C4562_03595 [Actinomycetota bacterium]